MWSISSRRGGACPRPNRTGGFTLVEMMATAAILGTLSTIALPKFADLIESANERQDKQILRRVRLGIEIYYNDNDYFPPDIAESGGRVVKDYFRDYFDTGNHGFPVPKSNLGVSTPGRDRGTVSNLTASLPGLTNSNYHVLTSASYEDFGYNSNTGAFTFTTLFRDRSVYWFGGAGEGSLTTSAPGVPKCVWVSDKDAGRDAR